MSGSRELVWLPTGRPPSSVYPRVARTPAPTGGGSISLARAARGALRWWWQGLILWIVISVGLCAAIQFLIKPSYEAASLLRVEPVSQELFSSGHGSDNSYQNFMETQVQLIMSTGVLGAAVSGPERANIPSIRAAADPQTVLREMIQVKILPRSFLINVSTNAKSPTEAAAVVNAVVQSYLDSDAEWSEGMTKGHIKNLETYREGLQVQVEAKKKEWLTLAAHGNAPVEPTAGLAAAGELTKTNISLEEYKRVRSQLLSAQLELAEAEAIRDYRRSQQVHKPASAAPEIDIEARIVSAFRQEPDVVSLQKQMDDLDVKLAMVERLARKPGDPAAKGIERQIASLKAKHDQLWEAKYLGLKEQIFKSIAGPSNLSPSDQLRDASEKVATLKATITTLERTLATLDVSDREHNTDSVKSAMVQSDLKRLDEMLAMVDRRLEQLKFESRGQARVRLIDKAIVPTRASSDKRPKLLAMTPLGVLAVIFAGAMLLEIKAGRVSVASDLSRRVGIEAFTVPPLPSSKQTRSLTRQRSREELVSDYVHRVDHIREALCGGLSHGAPGRCVLITSAVGGEGKTTLASQLAVRCANAGASTLLIDFDLRRPSLCQLLEVPEGAGFADVLRGEATLEDTLVHLDQFGCDFLPAGLPEANPARLILGQRLGPLLDQLRRSYDVVIIDSPPVLPVPDALSIGRFVDGAVLATRYDSSRTRHVELAHQTLLSAGIPVLGIVINGVQTASHFGGAYTAAYTTTRPAADSI